MDDSRKIFKGSVHQPIIFFCFVLLGFVARLTYPVDYIFRSLMLRISIGLPLITLTGLIALSVMIIMNKTKRLPHLSQQNHSGSPEIPYTSPYYRS